MLYFDEAKQVCILTSDQMELPEITEAQMEEIISKRDKYIVRLVDGEIVTEDKPTIDVPEVYVPELTPEMQARFGRDTEISRASDLLDRHRNQKEFNIPTTLTDTEALEVAQYLEYLRDLPEHPEWPSLDLISFGAFNARASV